MGDERASGYQCAECGHGDNLTAFAYGYVGGPLAENGQELADIDQDFEETEVSECSIVCSEHEDAPLYKWVDGVLCSLASCHVCRGTGKQHFNHRSWDRCLKCRGEAQWWTPLIAFDAAPVPVSGGEE